MKFVTSDNREFDTMKEARAHEKSLKQAAGPRTRTLDALPEGLAADALADVDGNLAKQLVTLAGQISRARSEQGYSKPRAPKQGKLAV